MVKSTAHLNKPLLVMRSFALWICCGVACDSDSVDSFGAGPGYSFPTNRGPNSKSYSDTIY